MAATLESLVIAQQATQLLSNVRRDIRVACTEYKARLDAVEWTAAYVRQQTNAQGAALVTVLNKIASNQTAVENALVDWGVSVPDTTADYQLLRDAAIAMRDATNGNVSATLTQILTQVPAKTRLW